MDAAKRAARIIGVLILVQMVTAPLVNFVLMTPLYGPGFLANAAPHSTQIVVSVLAGLALGVMTLAIAVTAFPVFRSWSPPMAVGYVALATVTLALNAVEEMSVMSMLSLSQAYGTAVDRAPFEALALVARSTRNWAHYISLIVAGATLLVLYATLYRFTLIPRALAGLGLAAVALQLIAVAMPLFGHAVVFAMLAPLGVCQLVLALWLILKGFRASDRLS